MAKASKSQPVKKQKTAIYEPDLIQDPIGRYINPLTDFGFKRIFGTEANKDLLIDFLNSVLEIEGKIVSLIYRNPEQKGRIKTARDAFLDLYCTTGKGEHIIVEMQNLPQTYFIDRVMYYVTFPIQKQAKKGKWNFKLKPVYSVNILNFTIDEDIIKKTDSTAPYHHHAKLIDVKTGQVIYNKLSLVFIELPDFQKPADELNTNYEHWLYVLKYLANLKEMPDTLKTNKIFKKLFIEAEVANMTPEELDIYDKSIKNLNKMYTTRDIVNDWRREAVAARKENIAVKKNFIALQNDNIAKENLIAELQRKLQQAGLN